jgi:hypothetical protein
LVATIVYKIFVWSAREAVSGLATIAGEASRIACDPFPLEKV